MNLLKVFENGEWRVIERAQYNPMLTIGGAVVIDGKSYKIETIVEVKKKEMTLTAYLREDKR